MLRIAGQMAGPIGLNFFVDTHGWGGEIKFEKKNFPKKKKKIPRATPGPSASNIFFYHKKL